MTGRKHGSQFLLALANGIGHRPATPPWRYRWLSAVFLLTPGSGHASDIALGANGVFVEEFNSNIFLTPDPHKESLGQGFNANLNMTLSEKRWQSRWNADFINRWYLDDSNLDYDNQIFSTRNHYDITPRLRIGFDANYNNDSTLSASGDTNSDVGYVFQRLLRNSWGLSPNCTYSVTERTRFSAQYSHQETTYDKKRITAGRVVDSMSDFGVVTVEHQYSEKLSIRAVGTASSYDMPFEKSTFSSVGTIFQDGFPVFGIVTITNGGVGTINTQSLSLGFTYTPNETIKLDFSGGGQFNQVSNPGSTFSFEPLLGEAATRSFSTSSHSSSFSEILSAEAIKKLELGELGFTYNKTLSPNLLGTLISSERYGFTGRFALTDQLTSNFRLSVTDTASSDTADNASSRFLQRSLFDIGAGLSWALTETISLSANYQYRQIEYPSMKREAEDHSVFLRLQYNPVQTHF